MNAVKGIEGGYVLIATAELCMAWSLYRTKSIRLVDLRVWCACKEILARRRAGKARLARFGIPELHRLVGGVGGEHLRASLRRLEAARLVWWSEGEIRCSSAVSDLREADRAAPARMMERITTAKRLVPVPRRHLRLIAGGARRAVIATLVAHLARCLFVKAGAVSARGFCKASWVAEVFGVAERNVKEARGHLVRLGVLVGVETPQWRMNRLGKCLEVNLSWSRTAGQEGRAGIGSTPPRRPSTTGSAPPESNRELLTDHKNQNPATGGRSGSLGKRQRGAARPTLTNVVPEDLRSTERTLELFRQAARDGLLPPGESSRLQFLAAAEHARARGSRNPCGLFAAIVRRGLWHVITQGDEDAAAKRAKEFRSRLGAGPGGGNGPPGSRALPRELRDLLTGVLAACAMPPGRAGTEFSKG